MLYPIFCCAGTDEVLHILCNQWEERKIFISL